MALRVVRASAGTIVEVPRRLARLRLVVQEGISPSDRAVRAQCSGCGRVTEQAARDALEELEPGRFRLLVGYAADLERWARRHRACWTNPTATRGKVQRLL